MDSNLKNIKRRERRFYRTYDNGEIKYSDNPVVLENSIEEKPIIKEETKAEITDTEKKKIIDKILSEMNKTINPNIDEISEVIYSQLSNNNISVSQETVKQVIENVHGRRSRQQEGTKTTESKEALDYFNDRKEMELVIDNIVEENIKEQTREKNKPQIEKPIEKKTETHSRRNRESEEKKKVEEKPIKKKEEPSPKPKPKKEELDLDFGDNDNDIEEESEEDDLGLKF